MAPFERALCAASVVLISSVLAGLVVRRRLTACVSWVVYLAAVAASDALIAGWPERFWKREFWIFKENVHNLLKLAIGLELMVRVFHHFPSAYVSVRRGVIVVVAALGFLVWTSLAEGTDYVAVVGRLNPHVTDGTVWLFVALGAYCLWYHLPLDSIHKAILVGLVPYLLVYSVVQRGVAAMGWERGSLFNLTAPHAYLALLAYWAWVAWRREPGDAGTRVARMVGSRG